MRILLVWFAMVVLLSGCGTDPLPSVGGLVEAPDGEIAAAAPVGLFARATGALLPQAWAMTGLDPVGRGVSVRFQRIDAQGRVTDTLITVGTFSDGAYSIDLASNEVPGSGFQLAVGNSSTTRMRAFMYANNVDINPASEATVRLVLDSPFPLANYSATDLQEIQSLVNAATANVASGDSIAEANDAAVEAAAADPAVIAAIARGGA